MQLFQKLKYFIRFFYDFMKYTLDFGNFEKKDERHSWCIPDVIDYKKGGYITVSRVPLQYTQGQSKC